MKWIVGLAAIVGTIIAICLFLPSQPQTSSVPSSRKSIEVLMPQDTALSSSSKAPRVAPSPVPKEAPSPMLRVQTSTDLFALYNELKSAQFGSDKQTAAARYAAFLALEECTTYIKPDTFRPVLVHIQGLPSTDANKPLRLKAYEFDMARCAGFAGWTLQQMGAEKSVLREQAARLGSPAARLRQAHYRYLDNFRKPGERQVLGEALEKIQPDQDGAVLNEASRFIGNFRDYRYTSQNSGQHYDGNMVELALYSLACVQGGLCAALTRGTNSQACWLHNDCTVLSPDQYIARERLAPAQYERFLELRQELQASFSAGQWPAGFWNQAAFPPVRVGTAVTR